MNRKKQFVKDMKKDDIINDIFVVKFKKPIEQYKNGFKFELRVGDSSREIMYKFWGSPDEAKVRFLYDMIHKDDVILLTGRVNEWNSNLEISANDQNSLKILQKEEYYVEDFIKRSLKDKELMWTDLKAYIDSVQNNHLKDLLKYFFGDENFASKFKEWPAAMYIHHGWLSGLLEHTLDVVKLCDNICKIQTTLDRDLTLTGALLHDIGKLEEFEITTSIRVSIKGMLIGHVTVGIDMINKAMDKLNTPENLRMKIVHIMLTHMGEYGSNKLPSFPEALVVFRADQLNGDLTHMITLKDEASTEDDYIYHKDFGNIYLK